MMKMLSRILSILILSSLGLFYAGCGGGNNNEDPAEKVQLEKLKKKQWTIQYVTHEGATVTTFDVTTKLTISGTYSENGTYQYAFAGTMPTTSSPWPRSGTFKFGSDKTKDLVRLDDAPGLSMTYTLTDTKLTISFTFPDAASGYNTRTEVVGGEWIFTFN